MLTTNLRVESKMRQINANLIFFSVWQNELDYDINVENSLNVFQLLKERGIEVVRYLGKYKGQQELSFCINANDWDNVIDLVEESKQESVLFVSGDRHATLIFMDNRKPQKLGTFKKVPSEYALELDAWSYNPTNKTFFIVE
jgi:hypothetical protein